ncbi:MAG: hypothetical protein HYY20_13745 [Candidatus Tectomicrobia bacterium]|uniref:Uncharacterized protein n=1 Tax=Tectimicrobiota bacterium TaxID=2528274 RepID=A0A932FZY2_UNCTE|nr:hypothetical protein [Candidatus Tectomicrobia bacterium]
MDRQSGRPGRHVIPSRRSFFKFLAGEVTAFFEELCGRPQLRLADLGQLPDETLAQIMPKVPPGVEILVTEGHIRARCPGKEEPIILFDRNPANTFVFNRFNGLTPLGGIGAELAATLSWDGEHGFAHARSLFLRLVRLGVCVPGNPIRQ